MTERNNSRILGILLIIMAVVSTGQTAWYSWEQQKCNEAFAQNLVERGHATQDDRAAVYRLFRTIYNHPADDQAEFRAFRHYFRTYHQTARRYANLPLDPDKICD